ncbi:MAG: phospholipase D family protein [Gammaproteobacteria bacterium]|nr:phospholipase D family protein [Gammaproteobacteria bacterium]
MTVHSAADTRLGQALAPLLQAHPSRSGVVALRDGSAAFAARALLADAAQRTLDVQYYIWHADTSGTLLLDALRRAAARGVRVRILLDDHNTSGLDGTLTAFTALANVEVRLFNPFRMRDWRVLGFMTDFSRLNRRMHNKSFTVDDCVTIVGGRNVGDEYFGARSELTFVDLDILAVGPIVGDVSQDFERYWTSAAACPAAALLPPAPPDASEVFDRQVQSLSDDPVARSYSQALASPTFVDDVLAGRLTFDWSHVQLLSDDPAKIHSKGTGSELMWARLKRIIAQPRSELILASAYFVPGAQGVADLKAMAAAGVRITVLTNSLEATDVPAVHAGYAKRRVALLRGGIALYEFKRNADPRVAGPLHGAHWSLGSGGSREHGMTGSSGASLHTKAFAVDGERVFVGSFNFDPRSTQLNTEMGLVIDSPTLAQSMIEGLNRRLPSATYRVRLGDRDKLQWVETLDGRDLIHHKEPGRTFWRRIGVAIASLLPIEWLL